MSIRVSQLFHFPVKSLRGRSLDSFSVDSFGAKWDRRFMLVESNGKFVTQRQCPKMCLIRSQVKRDQLVLSYLDETISIPIDLFKVSKEYMSVTVWDDIVNASVIVHNVNKWLSEIVDRTVTLCFIQEDTIRQVDMDYAQQGDRTGFADGFPFLIISEASIRYLNEKLDFNLSVERFRPNIVVSGCAPFAEDQWKKIKIGEIEFELVKPCSRCVIPTIDLETAEKQPEVMKVMLEHRKQGKYVMMGQNALHRGEGNIELNQEVEILI